MTFHILAFGCQMNVNEAVWLERALLAQGMEKTSPEKARVLITLTCSVREKPEQKVYSLLGRWQQLHQRDPSVFVAVGGCVAQQIGKEFWNRFPFVRLVFGTDGLTNAPQAIARLVREPGFRISLLDFSKEPEERPFHLEAATAGANRYNDGRAFINIMQGCDNFCAYCIVPYVRGRQKSRSPEAVLEEVRSLTALGVREVTLLGQNVNSYGLDAAARAQGGNMGFARLLRAVASVPGVDRVRFTTSHPKDLDSDVVRAYGEVEQICPHLHLPLQSGSDRVLAAMGRKYDLRRYMDTVAALRRSRPDIALTTDIIVGFPGETEEDFQATMDVLQEVGYDSSFSFMYSDRPGVRSERLTPKIPQEVKAERLTRLQTLQEELTRRSLERAVGSETDVLLEGPSRMPHREYAALTHWKGRDGHNRVVNVAAPPEETTRWRPGMILKASIVEAKKHSLFGKAKGEPW